jgi:hypothetical protein
MRDWLRRLSDHNNFSRFRSFHGTHGLVRGGGCLRGESEDAAEPTPGPPPDWRRPPTPAKIPTAPPSHPASNAREDPPAPCRHRLATPPSTAAGRGRSTAARAWRGSAIWEGVDTGQDAASSEYFCWRRRALLLSPRILISEDQEQVRPCGGSGGRRRSGGR